MTLPTQILPLFDTFCDQRPLSELEQTIQQANILARSAYLDWFKQATIKEKFGKKAICEYNNMNDIHYFINLLSIMRQELDKYIRQCGCLTDEVLENFKNKYKVACIIGKSACKYDKLFSDIFKLFLPKLGYCNDNFEYMWEQWACYLEPTEIPCYSEYEISCLQSFLPGMNYVNIHYTNTRTNLDTFVRVDLTNSRTCSSILEQIYSQLINDVDFVENFEIVLSISIGKIQLISKKKFFEHAVFLSESNGLISSQTVNCDISQTTGFVESYKLKCTRDTYSTGTFELEYRDPVVPTNMIRFTFFIDFDLMPANTCEVFINNLFKALIADTNIINTFNVDLQSDCPICQNYILLNSLNPNVSLNLTALTTFIGVTPVITYT
jgi:hypothetical protein